MKNIRSIFLYCFIFLGTAQLTNAQQEIEKLYDAYETYKNNPRELTYTHLNKSIYIKGETLGFTSYALDKETKKTSLKTSNLYCVVEDANKNIIKSKLIKIENGVGNGSVNIDSLFTTGQYVFKAYTNWQRNFEEQNFYTQSFEVIDTENQGKTFKKNLNNNVDAQFLPESGHALYNVGNTFGVVLKNSSGFGIPNISGKIVDSKNNAVSSFKTNSLGVSKFSITPSPNKNYKISLNIDDKIHDYKLDNFKSKGIILNLKSTASKVYLVLKTNNETLKEIKNKKFHLAINNGNVLKTIVIDFNEKTEITRLIKIENLNTGINIFTLFDEDNKPILERLFFNYNGISKVSSSEPGITKTKDTAIVSLQFNASHFSKFNNISVSILPKKTRSYNQHHNIISYTYLQPYIKSYVENAQYYFTDIDAEKKYHLDNLLITQGWSSYNWFDIFNNPPKVNYVFENGVYYKATVNNSKSNEFIMYPTKNNSSSVFNTTSENNQFELRNFFPVNNEELKIAEFNDKGKIKNPHLYIQFYPSIVPKIENKIGLLNAKYKHSNIDNFNNVFLISSLDVIQELDEVVIEVNKREQRREELQRKSYGIVDVWDDKTRERTINFATYFSKWFTTRTNSRGEPEIMSTRPGPPPLIFLDDVPQTQGLRHLAALPMAIIDYVEINKSGIGENIRGGGGVIKIYTDITIPLDSKFTEGRTFKAFKIPLTFSDDKKFYKPIYASYTSNFYNEYGVLEWLPRIKINTSGVATFKMEIPKIKDAKLFIEGMTEDGNFISETKVITLN